MEYQQRRESIATLESGSTSQFHPQNIGPWRLGKTLGRGATGRVLLATNQNTGQKAAVKVVSKSELQDDELNRKSGDEGGLPYGIEREIIIMKLLNHPNVLRLYDVWETSKALYLVLEYVEGGELFDLLVERGPLQEMEAIKYFRQIILGTAYCHALGICHRDLKPENLLLDSTLNVKLADFGMAALESNGKLLETSCGSPHYAAPEIVSGLKYHGAASDVWSCGVILFALLTGRLPFDDENIRNLLLKVQAGNYEMPSELSAEAQDLINLMLTVNPSDRISTDKILSHRLLTKYPIPNEDLISVKSLPHPETAYKSLGSVKNIDKQILQNLSILWHDRSEKDIVNCLLTNGSNPEKTFYALLLRYKHSQDEAAGTPTRSSVHRQSSISRDPKKKRLSAISASTSRNRVSFQHRNGARSSYTNGRLSAMSSANNSPYKSPTRRSPKRLSYFQSPRASPSKYYGYREDSNRQLPSIPRNIYNEIVAAQESSPEGSVPPSLPSKDNIVTRTPGKNTEKRRSIDITKSSPSKSKRESMIHSMSKRRLSKGRSIRASLSNGLKRNSITMKLLSTYTKLSNETEWEYIDKQTRRTSATFATLCDKIFNQEDYDEADEQLIDDEEKEAREYERLMEQERRKHEAELRARKELTKQRKRQKRKSLFSSKKLAILIKEDGNNSDLEQTNDESHKEISQSKRRSKDLRTVSESDAHKDELTREDVERLKTRSVTQPTRRHKPNLSRRPVSRLDPLWAEYENEKLDRAQDVLEDEYNQYSSAGKENKRDSIISINDHITKPKEAHTRKSDEYDLPEPDLENASDIGDEYMNKKKARQHNQKGKHAEESKKKNYTSDKTTEPSTLIGNINIPNVTRKSRCFTNSNKRLSVLSMYSTKESFHDLNAFIHEDKNEAPPKMPTLRTSFADRLDKAGLPDEEDAPEENGSILDFDEHLANKRMSYYSADTNNKRISTYSTVKKNNRLSDMPAIPDQEANKEEDEDTFITKNDEIPHKQNRRSRADNANDDGSKIFESIKLPDEERKSHAQSKWSNAPRKEVKPLVDPYGKKENQPLPKLRNPPQKTREHDNKLSSLDMPFEDARIASNNSGKRNRSLFGKLSWGSRKPSENGNPQLPSPADSRDPSFEVKQKPKTGFFRWLSGNKTPMESEIKRYRTILPKQEMTTALYSLLCSWSNFGLKNLRNDSLGFNITGEISRNNAFNLKHCRFRIKISPRDSNQRSELVCVRVKGSSVTFDMLFREVEKVLRKEGVMDT
ncbi:Piso0_005616 [Millerozyma farinosa CBS 7064]|uniref:non-specific serine/threonine protein kinase n=1 Tax=Pichia sorbitophila (strain ATCC MYA-4447 / BCRC 22081 / CBS 7064 / NBRC 10061 / NRRL Y-12695) TaxID=559304 RepID=G8XZH0_PICSO|nr:Piso0_005616 [Millerozyma farinosa CBS 7064]